MVTTTALLATAIGQATLSGVVRDSVDLEPIGFAHVTVAALEREAATVSGVSDRHGAFVVPGAPAGGSVRVEVSAFGYATWTRAFEALPSEPVRVLLSPEPIALEGLEAVVGGRAGDPISLSRDAFVIDAALMRTLPTILETDVLRATAVSPSASAASDYTSVPFIRGGASYGTPVLLDGVRLFNAFHLGGFLSAISAEAVERATVLPSAGGTGMTIGSLSGAIDIATRDGARDEMRVLGALGLASSRLSVEGPVGENVSYLLNGRRTYIDGVTLALSRAGFISQHVPYSFQDVHGKVTADLGGVRRLSVSGYLNTESLERFDQDTTHALELAWGNIAVSAHYRDRIGDAGILDANLGSSHFTSDLLSLGTRHVGLPVVPGAAQPVDTLAFGTGAMSETRADLRATWHLARSTLVTGVQATRYSGIHDFELADEFISDEGFFVSSFTLDEQRWRLAAYSSVEIPLAGGLSTRAGLRADRFEGLATTLAPFAELGYEASWWDLRVSAARSHQMLASARDEEAVGASFLAYDLLVPVARAPVPRNTEVSVGWQAARGGLRFRLDAYARMLDHLRLPPLGKRPSIRTALADPSRWEVASGTARGIETTTSWISDSGFSMLGTYRWARVQRTVGLRKYTPRFHREHELEVGTAYAPGASSWSARFSLRSGQPETEVLALAAANEYHRGEAELVVLGGEYNAGRLPHYMRIDIGWRRDSPVSWFGGGTLTPYVSVANLFSLPNVVGWRVRQDFGDLDVEKVYLPQLPMLPFFGVDFRF